MSKKRQKASISNMFVWQFLSQFFLTGISIITTPVFTRLLSTEEYGKFTNYNSWVVLIGVFAGLQSSGTIANAKVRYKEDEYRSYLSSIVSLTTISYAAVLLISIVFSKLISKLTLVSPDLISIMVMYSYATYMMTLYSQVLMMDMNAKKNAIIAFINALLTVALSIVLVLSLSRDKQYGRVYGTLIPTGVIAAIEAITVVKKGRVAYKTDYWKFCRRLSIPLIFHALAGTVLSLSDRIMLTRIDGDESTAIYSVAYSIGAMVNVLWTVYNTTWVPFYYQYKKDKDTEKINIKLNNYTITFSLLVGIFVLCIPEAFKLLIPKAYWIGINMIPVVAIGYYLNFMYSVYGNFEFFHEQTKLTSIGTVAAAVINIILNQVLITKYSYYGAAWATAIAYGLLFVFHYVASNHFVKEDCEIKVKGLLIGLLGIMVVSTGSVLLKELWIVRWMIAVLLGIVLIKRVIDQRSII